MLKKKPITSAFKPIGFVPSPKMNPIGSMARPQIQSKPIREIPRTFEPTPMNPLKSKAILTPGTRLSNGRRILMK